MLAEHSIRSRRYLPDLQVPDSFPQAAVRDQAADRVIEIAPDRLLEACPASTLGRAWHSFLIALDGTADDTRREAALRRVGDLLRLPPLRDAPDARDYAIQRILPLSRPRETYRLLHLLADPVSARDIRSAIRAASREVRSGGSLPLTSDVVEITARFEHGDEALLSACGHSAGRLNRAEWEELNGRLRDAPPTARRHLTAIRRRSTGLPAWLATLLAR